MRVIGIDPGCYGAIALLESGKIVKIVDMPFIKVRRGKSDKAEIDGYTLANVFREILPGVSVAYVEQVGGMTGQSPSAAFNFGRACGAVEYMLKGMNIRVEMVAPGTWKKGLKVNAGKDGSRQMAMRLWPESSALFARKKDNDRAEAGLIAMWGTNQHKDVPVAKKKSLFD